MGAAYSMHGQDGKCVQNLSPKNLNKETIQVA
jgi:hypothetical protein